MSYAIRKLLVVGTVTEQAGQKETKTHGKHEDGQLEQVLGGGWVASVGQ